MGHRLGDALESLFEGERALEVLGRAEPRAEHVRSELRQRHDAVLSSISSPSCPSTIPIMVQVALNP
eukprot:1075841-Rhodomonas_salina.2